MVGVLQVTDFAGRVVSFEACKEEAENRIQSEVVLPVQLAEIGGHKAVSGKNVRLGEVQPSQKLVRLFVVKHRERLELLNQGNDVVSGQVLVFGLHFVDLLHLELTKSPMDSMLH